MASIFVDEAAAKTAFEDLRNDTSATNWVLVGYPEGNIEQVTVLGKGEGGFSELSGQLKDDDVFYAILGLNVIDEGVSHLKYIFIAWVGQECKPLYKARSSQHRLPIYNFANTVLQLSGEYQALTREELTEELLKQKLAGTKVASENQNAEGLVLKSKGAASSEKFQFENEEEAKAAIQGVRSDSELKWALFGYTDREDIVKLIKTGNGGVDSWKDLIQDGEVAYVISGVNVDAGDYANQIKFIEITWVGPDVKPLHKARSSQHRVQIYRYAKELLPLSGEAQFLNKSELSEQALTEKLLGTNTVGAKSEEELRKAAAADAAKKQQASAPAPKAQPEEFKTPLSDEAGVKTLISTLGKPGDDTNWITFAYDKEGSKKEPAVVFSAKGKGGVEEVLPLLQDDEVLYILQGHVAADAAAEYSTLKFIFITWVGPKVKPLHKARSSQHRVALYNFIDKIVNLAGELQLLNKEELTPTLLSQKLTGSKLVGGEDPKATSGAARTARSPAAARKEQLTIADEEAAKAALLDVHNGNTATNWVVFTPTSKPDTLSASATGSGGLDELKSHFKDDEIAFGVLTVTFADESSGEEYKTVKNIFISWVGPDVKPLLKARSSQLRLGLYNYIKAILTLHGELQALNSADVSSDIVNQKLSGSKA